MYPECLYPHRHDSINEWSMKKKKKRLYGKRKEWTEVSFVIRLLKRVLDGAESIFRQQENPTLVRSKIEERLVDAKIQKDLYTMLIPDNQKTKRLACGLSLWKKM